MILQTLREGAAVRPDDLAVVVGNRTWNWNELLQHALKLGKGLQKFANARVGIGTADAGAVIISLAAAEAAGASPVLLPASFASDDSHLAHSFPQLAAIVHGENGEFSIEKCAAHGRKANDSPTGTEDIVLFTSGTSGPPHPVAHRWPALADAVRRSDRFRRRRWLMAYQPRSFAGLAVVLQALVTSGVLVAPPDRTPGGVFKGMSRYQVEMASATPTYFRSLLHGVDANDLRRLNVKHLTLGGEVVDQPLLDALAEVFAAARITHIYASTELGVCFSVRDGRAGFPAAWLESGAERCRLRVAADGQLLVATSRGSCSQFNGQACGDGDFFPTGDLVEITGDRVHFIGRQSDTIHVGGLKVLPARVEQIIRRVPHVADARVYGVDSSLTGQVVAAAVQVAGISDEDAIRSSILSACRRNLPKYMVPATLTVSKASLTDGDKISRRA